MDKPLVIVLITLAAAFVVKWTLLLILCRGDLKKLGLACKSFWRGLRDAVFADQMAQLLNSPPPQKPGPAKPSGVPLRALAILQREGRLVDFLMENLEGCADAQILDGIRFIHPKCQAALKKYLVLEPVLAEREEEMVAVPTGFDPSAIRLVGNVSGTGPYRGILKHPGWRVREQHLPQPPQGQDELVLMPAEVEVT